jgi:ubiquinone/menaquinone biosynthesis C-methylase UbiE
MYKRLAAFLAENLDLERASTIIEVGSGRGQLTIPFVKEIMKTKKNFKIVAYDASSGPYEGHLDILKRKIRKEKLESFVATVEGDVRNMKGIDDESFDLIISNELLCDLDRRGLEGALQEFYRILKSNGQMAHAELNPVPENEAQRLLIEANAWQENLRPKPEWFSPYSDEVAIIMHRIGFRNIRVKYFETSVKMSYEEAISQLKKWKTEQTFIQKHLADLKNSGLELPFAHVIFCEK